MTADRARGALAVLQDADGKFICEVPCGSPPLLHCKGGFSNEQ